MPACPTACRPCPGPAHQGVRPGSPRQAIRAIWAIPALRWTALVTVTLALGFYAQFESGRPAYARSVRVGGDEIDEAVIAHVKSEYSLLLGERSAEDIKIAVGSAFPLREEGSTRVRGRDLVTGLPKTVAISSAEVRRAIEGPVLQIVDLVRATLDVCPPELAGDILDGGITLTGGGALLRGLDERLRHELGVPVRVADDPLRAVVRGSGRCVEEFGTLERVLVDTRRY